MRNVKKSLHRLWITRSVFVVVGFLLTLLLWEGIFTILAKKQTNHLPAVLTQSDQQKYRILALGESTTAQLGGPAWPEYLEQLLNSKAGYERFRVINAGVSGTNTRDVSKRIEAYESAYHPSMVISMLGINDVSYPALPELSVRPYDQIIHLITGSRVYKFISIVFRQIVGKSQRELLTQASVCTDMSMGEYTFQTINQGVDNVSERLAYVAQYPFSSHGYVMLVDYYATQNNWNDVSHWVRRANVMEPYIRYCANVASKQNLRRYKELTELIDNMVSYISSMEGVANYALQHPRSVSAGWYQKNRPMLFTLQSVRDVDTTYYYRKIIDYFTSRSIPYVVMQYPMLSVLDIKQRLNNDPSLIFVSNEESFVQALQKHSYDEIFIDHFTGVFGHTTPLGSQIIAQTAADAIINIVPADK